MFQCLRNATLAGALAVITLGAASEGAAARDFTPPKIGGYSVDPVLLCTDYYVSDIAARQLTFTLSEPAKVKLTRVWVFLGLSPFDVKDVKSTSVWSGELSAGVHTMAAAQNSFDPAVPPNTEAFPIAWQAPDQGWYVLQARDRAGNWGFPVTSRWLTVGNGGHGGYGGTNGCP